MNASRSKPSVADTDPSPRSLRITVVTPSFNSAATVEQAIQSVLNQDYKNWEHIVVDGGSSDRTLDILKQQPHLKWTSQKDEGHYDAMNQGIQRATGDVIVILNSDDRFRPGAFSRVADAFTVHPEWDGLFGDVVFIDEGGSPIYQRREACYDYAVLLYGLDYICHQTMFVRRGVYQHIGAYRHKEFLNAADYEFKLRLGKRGCAVGQLPYFLVEYRYHSRGQSADRRIIRNMLEETALIRREYGNGGGMRGRLLQPLFKGKRQLQKIFRRGTCDLIPGTWRLRSHLKQNTQFSSNAGLDKLPAGKSQ